MVLQRMVRRMVWRLRLPSPLSWTQPLRLRRWQPCLCAKERNHDRYFIKRRHRLIFKECRYQELIDDKAEERRFRNLGIQVGCLCSHKRFCRKDRRLHTVIRIAGCTQAFSRSFRQQHLQEQRRQERFRSCRRVRQGQCIRNRQHTPVLQPDLQQAIHFLQQIQRQHRLQLIRQQLQVFRVQLFFKQQLQVIRFKQLVRQLQVQLVVRKLLRWRTQQRWLLRRRLFRWRKLLRWRQPQQWWQRRKEITIQPRIFTSECLS